MQSHSDRVRFLCQSALIAALYTALTFAVPVLSFGMMQLRISEAMTVLPILWPPALLGLTAGCVISNLLGGGMILLIGNVIKSQFLNIRDWPFGAATSITLTLVMGLMLLIYWRAARLLNKKVELE